MDNTSAFKMNSGANFEAISTAQATSNCKQTPVTDESSSGEIYEKQNLLLIENDNDIKY